MKCFRFVFKDETKDPRCNIDFIHLLDLTMERAEKEFNIKYPDVKLLNKYEIR